MYKYLLAIIALFLISGCSSKNYFEPQKIEVDKTIKFDGKLESNISYTSSTVAVLENGNLIANTPIFEHKIQNTDRVISISDKYIISVDADTNIQLTSKEQTITIPSPTKIVTATLKKNLLAVLLIDNSTKIIDIDTKQTMFINKGSQSYSIDTHIAQPLFVDSLILIPTIDGKIDVVDINTFKLKNSIIIDSSDNFANIIFMKSVENKLIVATRNIIKVIYQQKEFSKKHHIKDIKVVDNEIYLFGRDGSIGVYDLSLINKDSMKFKFAKFSAISIDTNTIKIYEKDGYFIDITKDLKNFKIYKIEDNLEGKIFVTDKRVYIGNRYFKIK